MHYIQNIFFLTHKDTNKTNKTNAIIHQTWASLVDVKLDPVRVFVPGDGDASEGVRRAARPLQSDHVLSRPAAALHQCQERPGSTQSQIKDGGKKEEEEKDKNISRKESAVQMSWYGVAALWKGAPYASTWVTAPPKSCVLLLPPAGTLLVQDCLSLSDKEPHKNCGAAVLGSRRWWRMTTLNAI